MDKYRAGLYFSDTPVIRVYVDDHLPERRRATIVFWDRLPEQEVFISELTVADARAPSEVYGGRP